MKRQVTYERFFIAVHTNDKSQVTKIYKRSYISGKDKQPIRKRDTSLKQLFHKEKGGMAQVHITYA